MADDVTEEMAPAEEPDGTSEATPASQTQPKTKLGWGIGLLVALTTIITLLAFLSIWANRQILDTDQWTETSTEVLASPNVQDALANYLVEQLFANLDIEGELQQELPPALQGLSGPISGGLRQLALKAAEGALAQPKVQAGWKDANRVAHAQLLAVLKGGNDKVNTENGVVTVNTRLILQEIADQIGVPASLVNKIPPSVGQLVIMRSDQLKTAQNASKAVKGLSIVFTILAVLLYVLIIWLAKGRRRRAVLWMGISIASVGLLMLVLQGLGRTPVVNSLATTSAVVPAVNDIYTSGTELLKQMAVSVFVSGLFVIFAWVLAGPTTFATGFRREVAPYLREYLPAAAAFCFLLFLVLIWWAPTHGFRTTGGLLLNGLLAISGFVALTLMTRREFPDAQAPDFAALGPWITQKWGSSRDYMSGQTSKLHREPKDGEEARLAELDRLQSLRERGALTDEEFAAQKKKLLGDE